MRTRRLDPHLRSIYTSPILASGLSCTLPRSTSSKVASAWQHELRRIALLPGPGNLIEAADLCLLWQLMRRYLLWGAGEADSNGDSLGVQMCASDEQTA